MTIKFFLLVSLCHATLNGNSGTFTSPNYPNEPRSKANQRQRDKVQCEWEIQVPFGRDIQLKFGDFDINAPLDECDKGEVEIFEGIGKNKSSIGNFKYFFQMLIPKLFYLRYFLKGFT